MADMNYQEIKGDLIKLALDGKFDVIAHGCNCFCTMGAGIAPQMAKAFGCDKYHMENKSFRGHINKLGSIDYLYSFIKEGEEPMAYQVDANYKRLAVINAYTQYEYGTKKMNVDYDAITLCMRKINSLFKGEHIGLPKIGAGLAGGDWITIQRIIKNELKDMNATIVLYQP